jgi:hypothetical protein
MTRLVTTARAAQSPGRPLQPPGCCASLRDRLRRPWTLEPLPTLRQDHQGQATACPHPRAARAHPEPGRPWTTTPYVS